MRMINEEAVFRASRIAGYLRQGLPQVFSEMPHLSALVVAGRLLAGAAWLLVACPALPAADIPQQETVKEQPGVRAHQALQVEIRNGLLNLKARRVPLRRILEGLVERMNLVVISESPLERTVTLDLDGVPLSEGVKRVLHHEAFMLRGASMANSGSRSRPSQPSTLWIFAGADQNAKAGTITLREKHNDLGDIAALQDALLSNDARLRTEAVKALRRLEGDLVISVLAQALADPEERVRVKAIYGLADIGGEQAAGALTAALGDASPWVRHEAVYALGVSGSEIAAQALRRPLQDGDRDVREAAIDAYVELGGSAAVNGIKMALGDPDPSIRQEAVEALWDIGSEPAAHALGAALDDWDSRVRSGAVRALGDIGGETARELLARAAAEDNDDSIKRAAADLLSALDE